MPRRAVFRRRSRSLRQRLPAGPALQPELHVGRGWRHAASSPPPARSTPPTRKPPPPSPATPPQTRALSRAPGRRARPRAVNQSVRGGSLAASSRLWAGFRIAWRAGQARAQSTTLWTGSSKLEAEVPCHEVPVAIAVTSKIRSSQLSTCSRPRNGA